MMKIHPQSVLNETHSRKLTELFHPSKLVTVVAFGAPRLHVVKNRSRCRVRDSYGNGEWVLCSCGPRHVFAEIIANSIFEVPVRRVDFSALQSNLRHGANLGHSFLGEPNE